MTNLPKVVGNRKKRLGRGYGSGKGGHTVGRGQKGQKSRTKIGVLFEGVKVKKSLLKRLPFQRGKGKNKGGKGPVIVNLEALNILPAGSKVTVETLIKAKIVDEKDAKMYGVKILGNGKLEKKLIIEVPASKSVLKFLEKSKEK
ncbi:MAG: uL15 family ribosomal protein [Patescibacteria group bacterium]